MFTDNTDRWAYGRSVECAFITLQCCSGDWITVTAIHSEAFMTRKLQHLCYTDSVFIKRHSLIKILTNDEIVKVKQSAKTFIYRPRRYLSAQCARSVVLGLDVARNLYGLQSLCTDSD